MAEALRAGAVAARGGRDPPPARPRRDLPTRHRRCPGMAWPALPPRQPGGHPRRLPPGADRPLLRREPPRRHAGAAPARRRRVLLPDRRERTGPVSDLRERLTRAVTDGASWIAPKRHEDPTGEGREMEAVVADVVDQVERTVEQLAAERISVAANAIGFAMLCHDHPVDVTSDVPRINSVTAAEAERCQAAARLVIRHLAEYDAAKASA